MENQIGFEAMDNKEPEIKHYIGTKIVKAEPAVRLDKKHVHPNDWPIPEGAEVEEGYRVIYPDGYESWSPKDVFEEAYRPIHGMNFGLAIEAAKKGQRITRRGWNGKGQYVFLADDVEFHADADISEFHGSLEGVAVSPVLVLRTAQGTLQPGWLASQSDMLAEDWEVVE